MHQRHIDEIDELQKRLAEIADEREHLPTDSEERREELLQEEHRLENRLTELEDQVVEKDQDVAAEEAAKQTDITKSPNLPDDTERE